MNESRFLFVLDVIVLNLLDEGRRSVATAHVAIQSNDVEPDGII